MNFKSHKKLLDIEWFDGPMMSLFTDKNSQLFIYKWINVNPGTHSWLVFRTNREWVRDYVHKMISERELILLAPDKTWYLVDISPELTFTNKRVISNQDLYQTVLPKSHVYFRIGHCPEPEKLRHFTSEEMVFA